MPKPSRVRRFTSPTILLLLFTVALLLRFYKLDTIPTGVLDDEASYGYIAYSLLETGKDEHGVTAPLHFKAFGDEKLPAYAYILVPTVKLFGLNNFATRLPSAFAGALLVIVLYAMLRKLDLSEVQSLFGSLVVAISPWTIVLSRFAFESNIALVFFAVGLWSIFSYIRSKKILFMFITIVSFAITWYAYVPYRFISTAVFSLFIALVTLNRMLSFRKTIGILCISIVLISPLLPHTFSGKGATRLNQIGLYNNAGIVHSINDRRGYCQEYIQRPFCILLANKPLTLVTQVISNQIRSLSPEFLFLSAEKDILYLSVANYGVLPVVLLPLFVVGFFVLLTRARRRITTPTTLLILGALIITTLPTALVGPPQRVRLSALIPFVMIIITMGYGRVLDIVVSRKAKIVLSTLVWCITLGIGFAFIIDFYFVHIPKLKIDYRSDIPAVMKYLYANANEKDVFFEESNANFPIHYAYHNVVHPRDFQKYARYSSVDSGGFSHPVGYKNLRIPTRPLEELICNAYSTKDYFYYVTNEVVRDMGAGPEIPVYTELSGDKKSAVSYIYLIDSTKYDKQCATD